MITIIGQNKQHIHLSAPRETHLKELEEFAPGYEIDSNPHMVVQDADNIGNLIWTLRAVHS